jgi:hypothetical protein
MFNERNGFRALSGVLEPALSGGADHAAEGAMVQKCYFRYYMYLLEGIYILLSAYTSLRKYIYISIIHIAEDSKYGLPLVEVDSSRPMYVPLCDVQLQNIMFFPELPEDLTLEQVPSIPSDIHEAPEGSRFYAIRKVCV